MTRTTTAAGRRADILAATLRLIAREGLAETTTRKIAAEAEVNQATLRYYFGSKDELLFAVLQEMMRMTGEVVQTGISSSNELNKAIAESIRAFWQHVEEAPELQVMQYELTLYALRHPESAWLAKQQYDGYSALVETLLAQNFATAGQSCAISFAELARFIISGLDGLILQFISNGRDTVQAHRDLDHLIQAVIALAEGQ